MDRAEWETRYPKFNSRFLAFCEATNRKPKLNNRGFAKLFSNYEYTGFINKMKGLYGKPQILDPDDFTDFIWGQAEKEKKEETNESRSE